MRQLADKLQGQMKNQKFTDPHVKVRISFNLEKKLKLFKQVILYVFKDNFQSIIGFNFLNFKRKPKDGFSEKLNSGEPPPSRAPVSNPALGRAEQGHRSRRAQGDQIGAGLCRCAL